MLCFRIEFSDDARCISSYETEVYFGRWGMRKLNLSFTGLGANKSPMRHFFQHHLRASYHFLGASMVNFVAVFSDFYKFSKESSRCLLSKLNMSRNSTYFAGINCAEFSVILLLPRLIIPGEECVCQASLSSHFLWIIFGWLSWIVVQSSTGCLWNSQCLGQRHASYLEVFHWLSENYNILSIMQPIYRFICQNFRFASSRTLSEHVDDNRRVIE